jgi:protein SCO1/2
VTLRASIRKLIAVMCIAACTSICALAQAAAPKMDVGQSSTASNQKISILDQVGIDQRLNQQVPLDLQFVDENGKTVQLKQYFGSRPVMLSLVYYTCPMLCSQVLNGMASALNVLRFDAGKDFDIVTVSIDPHDTPREAMDAKKKYLSRYRRPTAEQGWHFLTGKQDQIAALASAVGFRYAWDPEIQQFAHASGIMLLTPDGRIAQYYYGIEYAPRDLKLGLVEASKGKIGTVMDRMLLYCYHYDPAKGKYGAVIFNILRISALATLLALGGFIFIMLRRDRIAAKKGRLKLRTAD